ncbi:hypothetical protein POM88_044749 [Heracleum sosnowskyi]|uniref:Glucose-methanol-choline oxidoreductase N-terminal domain-containing protein n=1 Tax=Heracleum sosnowskyi TaxID=360622 RepID=A0AAD8H3D3_9APIA|nr:hypothetical protein POM88_044749 [Heracleum sosnowskyi]
MELGLNPKLAYESYPWIEKQIVQWPVLNPWQRAIKNALLQVGVTPDNGYTYEHLYGTKISGTIFDKDGICHGAAELLQSANSKNLDVLIHETAQKIVFDQSSGKPRAVGVILKDENGEQHEATLSYNKKSEVILSSGAIGSPQLLLLNRPVEQSLVQTVGNTREGIYIEASSGFGQSPSSIHYTHDNSSSLEEQNEELPHEAYNPGNDTFPKLLNLTVSKTINLIQRTADVTKSLEKYYRQTVLTVWHYHGECHKGKSPGTNPQATVMMLGRYMGIKILRKRLGITSPGNK